MLGADGSYYGPASLPMLDQWAKEGRILAETVLLEQGTNRQVLARDLPGLHHHFQLAPRQAPSQPAPGQAPSTPLPYTPYTRVPTHIVDGPRKSKALAAVLAFFFGVFGVHRFYLGHTMVGIVMLVLTFLGFTLCCIFVVATFVWAIIDMVMILTNALPDADGRRLD